MLPPLGAARKPVLECASYIACGAADDWLGAKVRMTGPWQRPQSPRQMNDGYSTNSFANLAGDNHSYQSTPSP
ncbi:MAG: hypothetical protein ACTHNQ_19395 [Microbacterium sp.]|uniref:hypothetical protein n=1 Tax=Microbacterium sp. TaxID=51671 RepID=UPI003F7E4A24